MVSLISRNCFIPLIGEFKVSRVSLLVGNGLLSQPGKSCLVSIQCRSLWSRSKPSVWESTTADVVLGTALQIRAAFGTRPVLKTPGGGQSRRQTCDCVQFASVGYSLSSADCHGDARAAINCGWKANPADTMSLSPSIYQRKGRRVMG